jgi:hypothetical protein
VPDAQRITITGRAGDPADADIAPRRRAIVSVGPPAGYGTIIVMGREG